MQGRLLCLDPILPLSDTDRNTGQLGSVDVSLSPKEMLSTDLLLCLIAGAWPFCYYIFFCFSVCCECECNTGESCALFRSVRRNAHCELHSQSRSRRLAGPCCDLRLQPLQVDCKHLADTVQEAVVADIAGHTLEAVVDLDWDCCRHIPVLC